MSQHDPEPPTPRLDRRSLLFGGGALGASGLLAARAGAVTSSPAASLSPARDIDPQAMGLLRGIQLTDANGIAFFDTVYPGFYVGRTAHVHVEITPHAGSEFTTQVYFPQSVNDRICGLPPYDQNTNPQDTNGADGFYDPVREFDLRRDPNGNGILAGFTVVVA